MLIKNKYPREDEYGGTEIASSELKSYHVNGTSLPDKFKSALTLYEPVCLSDDMLKKMEEDIRHLYMPVSACIIIGIILAILLAVLLTDSAMNMKSRMQNIIFIIGLAATIALFVFGLKFIICQSKDMKARLENAEYRAAAFTVQEKYSNRGIDNDRYCFLVINGVWINVDLAIYKGVRIGDKLACMFAYSENYTFFFVSDNVL